MRFNMRFICRVAPVTGAGARKDAELEPRIPIQPAVLHALGGMDKDLELVAQDDEFGRRIQDMNLVTPKRAKRKQWPYCPR